MTDLSKSHPNGIDYETAVAQTTEEIKRLLRGAPTIIRHMTTHLSKATGKMIRARALLACALQRNGLLNPDAVKTAAAVELLHLATLVHDDIIDNADKRRGIDALHKNFGEKYAVLCGDYLFCTALEFASTVDALEHRKDTVDRTFPRYLTAVCLGELRQNQNNHNYKMSEREYFQVIKGKTAALFEACFYTGFMFSDEADSAKNLYTEIGNNIGIIFQLNDDCADYEATQQTTKKPVLSDYSRGVITLPLIYALKTDASLYENIISGMSPEELKTAVESTGGLAYTHRKIEGLHKKTTALLLSLDTNTEKRQLLAKLLGKASAIAVEV